MCELMTSSVCGAIKLTFHLEEKKKSQYKVLLHHLHTQLHAHEREREREERREERAESRDTCMVLAMLALCGMSNREV